jgi:hypothetical protein
MKTAVKGSTQLHLPSQGKLALFHGLSSCRDEATSILWAGIEISKTLLW